MTAARLCSLCLHAAAALFGSGVFVAVWIGWDRFGLLLAALSLLAYGGYGVSRYLAWDRPK